MWIFDCPVVGAPNPRDVQGSAAAKPSPLTWVSLGGTCLPCFRSEIADSLAERSRHFLSLPRVGLCFSSGERKPIPLLVTSGH